MLLMLYIYQTVEMKMSSRILTVVTAILAVLVCRPVVAVVLSDFDRFLRACPSKNVNIWKIKVGNDCLLVTPAHVIVFPSNGKWVKIEIHGRLQGYGLANPSSIHSRTVTAG